MGFMGDQGILAFMPFSKCEVQNNAKDLDTLDELDIETLEHIGVTDFFYECTDDWTREDYLPPNEFDDRCFTPEYIVSPNSASCSGEPYHEDFFALDSLNDYFSKRHKVLFNLYAFDSMRTTLVSPPTLEIVNCEFKYFVNQLDALIQVETNNIGYIGTDTSSEDGGSDSRTLTIYGDDRGAAVTIEDSDFYSNSFCKGLIYYSRFQTLSFSDQTQQLNYTANYAGAAEVFYEEDNSDFIRITDSEFYNTGFHQVI